MIITKKQRETLRFIDNLDILIENEDLNSILIELDDEIILNCMIKQNELTPRGSELQRLYDELLAQNE
jgi:hypothetical protein